MNKNLITTLLLLLSFYCYSQQDTPKNELKQMAENGQNIRLKKSNKGEISQPIPELANWGKTKGYKDLEVDKKIQVQPILSPIGIDSKSILNK